MRLIIMSIEQLLLMGFCMTVVVVGLKVSILTLASVLLWKQNFGGGGQCTYCSLTCLGHGVQETIVKFGL